MRRSVDRMGRAAHAHISKHFVGDQHLMRYERLFDAMLQESQRG